MTKKYWGYRIDTTAIEYFSKELREKNCLRQGWGYHPKHDTRTSKEMRDKGEGGADIPDFIGARRNIPIYEKVKKGDILLVPRLPAFEYVAIVEATEDFSKGYHFSIDKEQGDYGHNFPAKMITYFARDNEHVTGNLRSTLKCRCRFWNIDVYAEGIEKLIKRKKGLTGGEEKSDRLKNSVKKAFRSVFKEQEFATQLCEILGKKNQGPEWEDILVQGFEASYPSCLIEKVGGKKEEEHGTDILISIPDIGSKDYSHAKAIQVKDWEGAISDEKAKDAIDQINKAPNYWEKERDLKIIEKILIFTDAPEDENLGLPKKDETIRFIFREEFKDMLRRFGEKEIPPDLLT